MATTAGSTKISGVGVVTDPERIRAGREHGPRGPAVIEISQRDRVRTLASFLEIDPIVVADGLVEALEREAQPGALEIRARRRVAH